MKAISLHLPWSHLVAIGRKRYETRSWQTSHRGLIAIHTTRTTLNPPAANMKPLADWPALYDQTPGCIVAIGYVVDCLPGPEAATLLAAFKENRSIPVEERLAAADELTFGDFGEGRFAWEIANVWRLPRAFYHRGLKQLWMVQASVAELIACEYERETGGRICRDCGCREDDCRQCIQATGEPCHWVERHLCSRCERENLEVRSQKTEARQARWLPQCETRDAECGMKGAEA